MAGITPMQNTIQIAPGWQFRLERMRLAAIRYRRLIAGGIVLVIIALGFAALNSLTHEIRYRQVRAAFHALSAGQFLLALGLSAASYFALTFYDYFALRMIGHRLPWRTAALASFTSYTLSHNLGLALLTGSSARYRIYVAAGLDGPDVARVIAIAAASFWAGVVTIACSALVFRPEPLVLGPLAVSAAAARTVGLCALVCIAAGLFLPGMVRRPIAVPGLGLRLSGLNPKTLAALVAVSLLDLTCAAAALLVLVPGVHPALLPAFVLAYALGIVAALISHVPGGIGVFEATVLALVPGDPTSLFAALIAYRLIYYLLPLALGVMLLAWHEGRRSRRIVKLVGGLQALAGDLSPMLLSSAVFAGGGMLLLSGSLPAIHARMGDLANVLPLPFIEANHVAASLVGTALLLLAPGLYRRLDGACLATRLLLVAGAIFSLAKGIDYEEAIVCLALAGLLHLTRHEFYRRTALMAEPITAGWPTAIAMAVCLSAWAGLFAYRHVPYADDLWWKFALRADAPRYLRAMLASGVLLMGASVWRLLAPTATPLAEPTGNPDRRAIAAILAQSERTDAMLALTGDKRFLISEAGDAFVMYRIRGASWVVMGDPVGAECSWSELLWKLRDLSHRQQGRLFLYEVTPRVLDLAIGMGLQIVRYGEEAVVDLADFDLGTPRLRSIRRSERAASRTGARFRIVPAPAVPVILDRLEAISDEWLRSKGGREKGFSLGSFDREYLSNFDMAIVTVEDRIVAFANLWLTANGEEASVDLMRQTDDAPAGTMDFLFANVMLWAKDRGYRTFTLGMVPLSGIAGGKLAPAWAKAAAVVFRHGEHFYGFRGLRSYKEKFAPRWEPRYIAGPHGVGLLQGLHDVSRLIGNPPPARVVAPLEASGTRQGMPPAREGGLVSRVASA
jgi:phosphatidylglycerol lysyltransferase